MYKRQALADVDDGIMEKFMEGEEPTIEEMKAAIRKGTIDCSFFAVPVSYTHLDVYKRQVQMRLCML